MNYSLERPEESFFAVFFLCSFENQMIIDEICYSEEKHLAWQGFLLEKHDATHRSVTRSEEHAHAVC